MGYIDTVTKEYMRENTVFADAFNYLIYDGEQVVDPERLHELDTTEIALPFGSDHEHNNDPHDAVQKYRDVLKSSVIMQDDEAAYVLLGIEKINDDMEVIDVCKAIEEMMSEAKAEACKAMEEMMAEGRASGIAEGKATGIIEGKIRTLADLVRDGLLSLSEAAKRADMSETDFEAAAAKLS